MEWVMKKMAVLLMAGLVGAGPAFAQPTLTQQRPDLDWVSQPSLETRWAALPPLATHYLISSRQVDAGFWAILDCRLTDDGHLRNCRVKAESIADRGIGEAALDLADAYALPPPQPGDPRRIEAPINFTPRVEGALVEMLAAPTPEQMFAAWPVELLEEGTGGSGRFACLAGLDGTLRDCRGLYRSDRTSVALSEAAAALGPLFKLQFTDPDGQPFERDVFLSVDFDQTLALMQPGQACGPDATPESPTPCWLEMQSVEAWALRYGVNPVRDAADGSPGQWSIVTAGDDAFSMMWEPAVYSPDEHQIDLELWRELYRPEMNDGAPAISYRTHLRVDCDTAEVREVSRASFDLRTDERQLRPLPTADGLIRITDDRSNLRASLYACGQVFGRLPTEFMLGVTEREMQAGQQPAGTTVRRQVSLTTDLFSQIEVWPIDFDRQD